MVTRQDLAPVLKVIKASSLPASCKTMLNTACSRALQAAVEDRHVYEEKILAAVSEVFTTAEAGKNKAVEDLVASSKELNDQLEPMKEAAEAARANEKAKKEEREAKEREVKEAEKSLADAKAAAAKLDEWKKVMTDLYEPLKGGDFPGQQWRHKNKLLKDLMHEIEPVKMDESLVDALQVVLKAKACERGTFAVETLKFSERACEEHQQSLEKVVVEAGTGAEATVDVQMQAATEKLELKKNEEMSISNEWIDLDSAAQESEQKVTTIEASIGKFETDLGKANAELEHLQTVYTKYRELLERSKHVPEPEVVADAPEEKEPEAEEVGDDAAGDEPPAKKARVEETVEVTETVSAAVEVTETATSTVASMEVEVTEAVVETVTA